MLLKAAASVAGGRGVMDPGQCEQVPWAKGTGGLFSPSEIEIAHSGGAPDTLEPVLICFSIPFIVSVNVPTRRPCSAAATGLFLALSCWQQTHKNTKHSITHSPPFFSLLNVLMYVEY